MTKRQFEFRVQGMTCVSCAQHVVRALESVEGVEKAIVPGWKSARTTVIADESVSSKMLVEAVTRAGYTATLQKEQVQPNALDNVMQDDTDFDLLVIGGGSGGFAAAIMAQELGKKVGLINAGTLGGTCVNIGCVPSKTLLRAAEAWYRAEHHAFLGVHTAQVELDWATIRTEKDRLVGSLRQSKYADILAAYPDITLIEGQAAFQPDGSIKVEDRGYRAHRYVIATGAHPRMLPIPGLEEAQPLDSTTLMDLDHLPKSLLIVGGRAVALEMGQMLARFGAEVMILQRSPRLIPTHEPEVGRAIQDYFEQDGIRVITDVQVERLGLEGESRVVYAGVGGQSREYRAEQLLMAVGRQANTCHLGLEHVGVKLDGDGAIIVNEFQQTSNPTIYATGDVTTNPEFVYVAAAGGTLAARNALTDARQAFDLSAMPSVIFTDPQIAAVGLTEAEARRQGYEVKANTLDLVYVPRAQAARDTRGLIKLVVDATTGRLLGAHVLAADGGEIIQTATLAVKFGLTLDDLTATLFPYLTQVEGLKLAALACAKDVARLSCCAS